MAWCSKAQARGRIDDYRRVHPGEKEPGSQVIGATVNGTGSLMMRAERVGSETLLAQIVQMVSQAQRSRAPIQRLADRVAGVVRARGDCNCSSHICRVEFVRARTAAWRMPS